MPVRCHGLFKNLLIAYINIMHWPLVANKQNSEQCCEWLHGRLVLPLFIIIRYSTPSVPYYKMLLQPIYEYIDGMVVNLIGRYELG